MAELASRTHDFQAACDDTDDLRLGGVRRPDEDEGLAVPSKRCDRGIGEVRQGADGVGHCPADHMDTLGVPRPTEHPMRLDDLELADHLGGEFTGRDVDGVDVPPLVPVGHHVQRAVGEPLRLLECLIAIAYQEAM